MSTPAEFYPVVHLHGPEQAVEQAGIALEAGAQGVFLIDMAPTTEDRTTDSFNAVDEAFPDSYVGVNLLSFSADGAFRAVLDWSRDGTMSRLPSGLWADDITVYRGEASIPDLRAEHPELADVEYLGGVAFKYTELYTDDPKAAAAQARRFAAMTDVVTTSGPGTGKASHIPKLVAMKEAIGDQPLAVASGVDPDNVAAHRDIVDRILLATGIETAKGSGIFDTDELARFVDNLHAND